MENSVKITFASIVKNNFSGPKSWYEQVEEFEKQTMSPSNSMSTILSDDTATNDTHSSAQCYSLDSGAISDESSHHDTLCHRGKFSKSNQNISTNGGTNTLTGKRKSSLLYQRRHSADSYQTTNSCCTDHSCSSNHDQLKRMCMNWRSLSANGLEMDEATLVRRQKQIDYGKTTNGYKVYLKQVPREQRTKEHPTTPKKHLKYSRRAFDGLIKIWRKQLHLFDPANSQDSKESKPFGDSSQTNKNALKHNSELSTGENGEQSTEQKNESSAEQKNVSPLEVGSESSSEQSSKSGSV